jgi:HK97 family phage major capsid protein
MKYNREIVQKADLQLADLAPGGILVPKQAAKFIKIAIKKSVMTSMVRVPVMTNPEEEHPKMLWTGRVMQPGTPGVALSNVQRTKPSFDKVTLTAKLGKAEVHIDREVLEDQIERGTFKNSIISFLGEKVSGDLEDQLIKGDTTSTDPWLAVQDGFLKKMSSNVVAGGTAALTAAMLDDVQQALPEEFDDQPGLKFFTNRKARSDYRYKWIGAHPDSLGAGLIQGSVAKTVGYDGTEIVKVPRFPNNYGGGTNETNVAYMDPKNVVMGFHRKVTLDTEFRISEQVWAIVVTVRLAIQIEHEPATAKISAVIGQ